MPKGFTLIELIVVVAIISILVAMGLGAYSSARRQAIIDIETDTLISALHTRRDEVRAKPVCNGVQYKNNQFEIVSMPYNGAGKKCDSIGITTRPAGIAGEVAASPDFSILFVPPKGTVIATPAGTPETVISIFLKNFPSVARTVSINNQTGTIEKRINY